MTRSRVYRVEKRKGGGGGGHGGSGHGGGGHALGGDTAKSGSGSGGSTLGGTSSSPTSKSSWPSFQSTTGAKTSPDPSYSGGGKIVTLSPPAKFAGRRAGGGTRDDVRGNAYVTVRQDLVGGC